MGTMKRKLRIRHSARQLAVLAAVSLGAAGTAHAKATAEEIAQIGKKYTCAGSERAGSPGGVAEFTGKWLNDVPGMAFKPGERVPDPYAGEKPLFTITAQNMEQYKDKLSDGQKAMFKKFPNTFKMNIYPSHRDFGYEDSLCKVYLENAKTAELSADGLDVVAGVRGTSLFPFPKSGIELVWDGLMPARAGIEMRDTDLAVVFANGTIQWGKQKFWSYVPAYDPKLRGQKYEGISCYSRIVVEMPEREKGLMTRALDFFNYGKEPRQGWQYNPGTRRVRQLPGFGFDMPIPSSGGTLTIDDTRLLNGSPERYDWKLIGKKELYVPYNGYRLESAAVGENHYAKLLTPGHENPEFVRWELHRVWVVEGDLKAGFRHLYTKRVLYLDEDSWNFLIADNFDARGNLWKFNWTNMYFVPGKNLNYHNGGTAFYHDVVSGNYSVYDMTQGRPKTYEMGQYDVEYGNPEFFSLENLKAGGY